MKFRLLLLFVAAIVTFALAGCNGPAPGNEPSVSMLVDNGNLASSNILAGTSVALLGTATVVDTTDNPVTSTSWTQKSETPGGVLGTYLITATNGVDTGNNVATTWIAPQNIPTNLTSEVIDLTLTVTTLLRGSASTTVHLVVNPAGAAPIYVFNYAAIFNSATANIVTGGTRIPLSGNVEVNGVVQNPSQYTFTWTVAPAETPEPFDNPTSMTPNWTAPQSIVDATTGAITPQTVYLAVTTTAIAGGYNSTNYLAVSVH